MSRISFVAALLFALNKLFAADLTVPMEVDQQRHAGFMADIKKMNGKVDLVFLGDSITDGWRTGGQGAWDEHHYAAYNALNLGISGLNCQNVLWQIKNGELDGYKAKLFVILIGTNNRGDSAEDVATAITAIVKAIEDKQPQAKILLMAIFPRGDVTDPLRAKNTATNAIIANLADKKRVVFLDIGDKFLAKDKSIVKDYMSDLLHPSPAGFEIWAKAIDPIIKQVLAQKP